MSKLSAPPPNALKTNPIPTHSAWARGPPGSATNPSPRSSSPAAPNPILGHQRRPSGLTNPPKDGPVSVRAGAPHAARPTSQVVFGSLDDAHSSPSLSASVVAAPPPQISAAPAAAAAMSSTAGPMSPISTANVKSFGSIPVSPAVSVSAGGPAITAVAAKASPGSTPAASLNGSKPPSTTSTAASTPAPSTPATPAPAPQKIKMDISKLFRGSGPSVTSPSSPTTKGVPSQQQPNGPPHVLPPPAPHGLPGPPTPGYAPFAPPHMRPGAPGAPGTVPPRSPQFQRAMTNGAPGPRPPLPGAPPAIQPVMGSPRTTPQQIPGQPPMPQPQPGMPNAPQMWVTPSYYYPYQYYSMPPGDPNQPVPQQWPGTPQMQAHLGLMGQPPPPPHGPVASPQPAPSPLAVPTIPGQPPQTPPNGPAVQQQQQQQQPQPPPTPSAVPSTPSQSARNLPGPGPPAMSPLASSFVPRAPPRAGSAIRITNPSSGAPVVLPLKADGSTPTTTPTAASQPAPFANDTVPATTSANNKAENRRSAIRIESPADKAKREAEEKKKADEEAAKKKALEDAAAKKKADEEKEKEKQRQEEERARKAAQEKKAAEELAAKKKAEEEAAAAAKKQKQQEEDERKAKEELAKKKAAEEEAAAAAAKKKAEEDELARKAKEEADAASKKSEDEAAAKKDEPAPSKEKDSVTEAMSRVQLEMTGGKPLPQLTIKTPANEPRDTRRRPGPINIDAARAPMTPGPQSALATARIITDISQVAYPDHIKSPRIELNMNAKEGKFRYDRDFLMQFMEVCKEKPDHLPPPEALGLEPVGAGDSRPPRKGSMGPPSMERRDSAKNIAFGPGGSGFQPGNISSSKMGTFVPNRPSSIGGAVPFPNRPTPMTRTPSQGGPGAAPGESRRTRSQRGGKRESKMSTSVPVNPPPGIPGMEPIAPLSHSDNAWAPRRGGNVPSDSAELVERKVKSLLNKLTMERFESISDQIIDWANKSEKEKDGRTLIQVIRLVFEKATDEATWSHMYARLCRKMMEQISPGVMDESIRNNEGQPITGGHLFRKYLLNRCQEDFERGWTAQAQAAAAAAEKAAQDDEAKKAAGGEDVLYSPEYYANQKAKRQGLGLVRFIGELFKLQMLTERIIHECIKKLLSNVDNPGEEEIESICKLLSTVGKQLDTSKARSHMDIYFRRMKDLSDSNNIDSRMRFMLQDVIELRSRDWVPRNAVAAPTTIAAVHDQAAKEKLEAEKATAMKMNTMSRGGSRRGDNRSEYGSQVGADGWSTPAGRAQTSKVGDLSQFGKISKAAPGVVNLGPSSVFVGKKGDKRDNQGTMSRSSSSNPFAALTENPGANAADAPSTSRSRKASVDFGSDAGGGRRKLNLLPRSKPLEEVKAEEKAGTPEESDEDAPATPDEPPKKVLSEKEIKQQIENDTKEFFAIRKLDESEQYFESLPEDAKYRMVESIFGKALEGKDAEATLAGELFSKVLDAGKISLDGLELGFAGTIEFLDDIAVDAPQAYALTAKILFLSGLEDDAIERLASKIAVEGDPLVAPKDKLLKEFQKLSSD